MRKKIRLFEQAQGNAQNIQVIGKLTLVVHSIDERTNRVVFVVNPSIIEYQETPQKQSVGFEPIADTRLGNMRPDDPPFTVTIDGTGYEVAVDCIGTTQDSLRRAYCDFVVSWS